MNLWRAPTENDGLKLFMDRRGQQDFAFYYECKAMYSWLDAGLDRLFFELLEMDRERDGSSVSIAHLVRSRTGREAGRFRQTLRFLPQGIEANFGFELDPSLPELPKIGLATTLAAGLESVSWYGRGPHEAYVDRKAGAALGRWRRNVDELQVPYVLPQENGNRTDTRWLEIRGGEGGGLRIEGDRPFDFTASHHGADQLWAARHLDELVRRPETLLCLDAAQRGLGTASCGPDTLERYRLRPQLTSLGLRFLPRA